MYCSIKIPVDEGLVVVTEIVYFPKQNKTKWQEFIPEHVEIVNGFAYTDEGEELDFDEVLRVNMNLISDVCLAWYKADDEHKYVDSRT